MKKLKTAKEQWENDMSSLCKGKNNCYSCNTSLGAEGENECYHIFGTNGDFIFTKIGESYTKYDVTDISAADLLYKNWNKLNPNDAWYSKTDVMEFLLAYSNNKETDVKCPIPIHTLIWMDIFSEDDVPYFEYKDQTILVCKSEELSELLRDMASYIDNIEEDCERNYYFEEMTQTGLFHDAIGKIIKTKENSVVVTTEY